MGIVGAAVHQPVGVVGTGFQQIVLIDAPYELSRLLTPEVWPERPEPPPRER